MASQSSKKLIILYILNVLKEYSDEDHTLTHQDIIAKIDLQYGMKVERKSIASNIENLIDLGFDIIKVHQKGCYLGQREFEPSEIQFLVDAVFSSKVISRKHSIELSKKLYSFLSTYQRKKFKYIYKAEDISKSNNKQLFYNIEMISEAIENKKKISFTYNEFDINQNLVPRQSGKTYLVNPYFMVNSQGRYYLVCNYDCYEEIGNYKIDLITNIQIVDIPVKDVKLLTDYKMGLNISKYINENIYMFGGKTITAKLKMVTPYALNVVVDWFGENAKIFNHNNELFAEINTNENAIVYWALQYGDNVELIEPLEIREKIKQKLKQMNDMYH